MTADEGWGRHPSDSRASVLLATKLLRPPQRAGLLARPRLVERLREGQRGPLTLISAPAGSGKTTTISAWVAATRARRLAFARRRG